MSDRLKPNEYTNLPDIISLHEEMLRIQQAINAGHFRPEIYFYKLPDSINPYPIRRYGDVPYKYEQPSEETIIQLQQALEKATKTVAQETTQMFVNNGIHARFLKPLQKLVPLVLGANIAPNAYGVKQIQCQVTYGGEMPDLNLFISFDGYDQPYSTTIVPLHQHNPTDLRVIQFMFDTFNRPPLSTSLQVPPSA